MESDWKLLIQFGLPKGAARQVEANAVQNLKGMREAVRCLSESRLDAADIDILAAWLSAFKHHFPSAFAEVLGSVGETYLNQLKTQTDPNRYLKLRRIAVANLAELF